MKKILPVIFLLSLTFIVMPGEVKIVNVPKNITVETDGFKETLVRNLCEQEEIFMVTSLVIYDDHIFLISMKPVGIYKLDLQGKTIAKGSGEGQGPGEFTLIAGNLVVYKNILVFHQPHNKLLFFNPDLEFVKEVKLPIFAMDYDVNNEGDFIFSTSRKSLSGKYFRVHSPGGKELRKFGEKNADFNPQKISLDYVFEFAYDPAGDGVWAALGNSYDLFYYEKERLALKIKEEKNFIREYKEKDKETGRMITESTGRPIKIVVEKGKVFYFYKKDKKFYCDIFNKNNYELLRRTKLARYYRRVAHYKDGIFYGIYYGLKGEEDYQLYRLELK